MSTFEYAGTELRLFSTARNWKNYIHTLIGSYIKGDVLEVGAGIGNNTRVLYQSDHSKWVCLEPDIKHCRELEALISSYGSGNCYLQSGTIDTLAKEELFDSILYLDVLEHIHEDREEVIKAYQHLKPKGYLVILVPAHQWLFTPFDTTIGHYRRYNKAELASILPKSIKIDKLLYLDCVGLLASLANRLILKQAQPTALQIRIWDRLIVPISKRLDRIIRHKLGKSILLIGRKKC